MSIVTAVIPAYNAAAFLQEALDSVKAQTVPPAEVLVVDDGSQDDTVELATGAGARVLSTGGRLGGAYARNLGVTNSTTPYVAFLDADDCWLPRHCEVLLELLRGNPSAAVAFGRIQRFGPNGDIPTAFGYKGGYQCDLPHMLHDNPIAHSSAIVDRAKFFEVGGYRAKFRLVEDYDLWLRILERFRILGSELVTCRYRIHGGQVSKALPGMIQAGWQARLDCRDRLRGRGELMPVHEAQLLEALADDVRNAWDLADREAFQLLLKLCGEVPGSAALRQSIKRKIGLLPLRRLVIGLRDLVQPSRRAG